MMNKTQTIETVMTREYWERNYRMEYRRELRETFIDTCKGILSIAIGSIVFCKMLCVIVTIIEIVTGKYGLF